MRTTQQLCNILNRQLLLFTMPQQIFIFCNFYFFSTVSGTLFLYLSLFSMIATQLYSADLKPTLFSIEVMLCYAMFHYWLQLAVIWHQLDISMKERLRSSKKEISIISWKNHPPRIWTQDLPLHSQPLYHLCYLATGL